MWLFFLKANLREHNLPPCIMHRFFAVINQHRLWWFMWALFFRQNPTPSKRTYSHLGLSFRCCETTYVFPRRQPQSFECYPFISQHWVTCWFFFQKCLFERKVANLESANFCIVINLNYRFTVIYSASHFMHNFIYESKFCNAQSW